MNYAECICGAVIAGNCSLKELIDRLKEDGCVGKGHDPQKPKKKED